MKDNKIIAFVGMPGAGKSVCVDFLVQKSVPSVYFGGITIDEVKARGLEVNEKNEKMVREDIRTKEGKAAYAKRIIDKIQKLAAEGNRYIVADGLYSWTEYKAFREAFGNNAIIVAITASRRLRHQRLATRPVRPLTEKEANARDYAEIENLEKGGPIANADYTIVNDSTTEELLDRVRSVLEQQKITI